MLVFQSAHLTDEQPGMWPEFDVDLPRKHEQIFVVHVRAGLAMPAPRTNVE